MSRSKRYNN